MHFFFFFFLVESPVGILHHKGHCEERLKGLEGCGVQSQKYQKASVSLARL